MNEKCTGDVSDYGSRPRRTIPLAAHKPQHKRHAFNMQIYKTSALVRTQFRPFVSPQVSVRGRGRVTSPMASSLSNNTDDGSNPQGDESWACNMVALAQHMERLRRADTVRLLQHGFQASVLESRAQELLNGRPVMLDPSAAVSLGESLAQQQEHGRIISSWHEDAWEQMRRTVHPASEDSSL